MGRRQNDRRHRADANFSARLRCVGMRKMPEPASEPRERPPSISDKRDGREWRSARPSAIRHEKLKNLRKEASQRAKPSNSVPGVFPLKRENSNLRDWPGALCRNEFRPASIRSPYRRNLRFTRHLIKFAYTVAASRRSSLIGDTL